MLAVRAPLIPKSHTSQYQERGPSDDPSSDGLADFGVGNLPTDGTLYERGEKCVPHFVKIQ